MPTLELTVADCKKADAFLGRARIDREVREGISMEIDEVVEIVGRRPTPATVLDLPTEDEGKGLVRVDAFTRRSAGVDIGAMVEVRKARVQEARRVVLAPVLETGRRVSVGQKIPTFVNRALLKRPVATGDIVAVPGIVLRDGPLPFVTKTTDPEGVVRILEGTIIELDLEQRGSGEIAE